MTSKFLTSSISYCMSHTVWLSSMGTLNGLSSNEFNNSKYQFMVHESWMVWPMKNRNISTYCMYAKYFLSSIWHFGIGIFNNYQRSRMLDNSSRIKCASIAYCIGFTCITHNLWVIRLKNMFKHENRIKTVETRRFLEIWQVPEKKLI